MFITLGWTSLIVVLALGVLGLWASYSFLNKHGLYLFSIMATILSLILWPAQLYRAVPMGIVLMPLVFFATLIMFEKFGKEDAKKLFFLTLISMAVVFVFKFFEAAYIDSAVGFSLYLSWANIGGYICSILGYAGAVCGTYFLADKLPIKNFNKYLRRSITVSMASVISCFVVVFLGMIGSITFGEMLLLFLISLLLTVGVSFGISYLAKFLNRKPATGEEVKNTEPKAEDKKEEPVEEETSEEKTEDKE